MEHGTKASYEGSGCKCDACRDWKRAKDAARRKALQARVAAKDPTLRHGTATLYNKGGCCDNCRDAYAATMRDWRADNPGAHSEHVRRWQDKNPERVRSYAAEQAIAIGPTPKSGDIWTGSELEIVVTRRDLTLTQIAKMLGRTRYAVASARHRATHDPKWIRVVGTSETIDGRSA